MKKATAKKQKIRSLERRYFAVAIVLLVHRCGTPPQEKDHAARSVG